MRYALGPLRQPAGRLEIEIEAPAPLGTGADLAGPVSGYLDLTNAGTGISVRGHLRVPIEVECARCLKSFVYVIEIEVNEDCALKDIDAPQSYVAEKDEACQIPILNRDEVDLSELVRELIAMHLPNRVLCRPDCAGLCPDCGTDLNESICHCREKRVDPRWQGLQGLKL